MQFCGVKTNTNPLPGRSLENTRRRALTYRTPGQLHLRYEERGTCAEEGRNLRTQGETNVNAAIQSG